MQCHAVDFSPKNLVTVSRFELFKDSQIRVGTLILRRRIFHIHSLIVVFFLNFDFFVHIPFRHASFRRAVKYLPILRISRDIHYIAI